MIIIETDTTNGFKAACHGSVGSSAPVVSSVDTLNACNALEMRRWIAYHTFNQTEVRMLEVELKHPVADLDAVRRRLTELSAESRPTVEQTDTYYNHPSRDFAVTDEALRIRTMGGVAVITYKGPKQGGAAKTRLEREVPLAGGTAASWAEVLTLLGFRAVASVSKQRTSYSLMHGEREVEVTLDEVVGLGGFVEVESFVGESDRSSAEASVIAVAELLHLSDPEPRSYLEMLLEKKG